MSGDISTIVKGVENMGVTGNVPVEVAALIIDNAPLEDAESFEAAFPRLDLQDAIDSRRSIRRYLKQLTDDPETAIRMLLVTESFISGSRAAEFFTPGLVDEHSDWDIYCLGEAVQTMLLMAWIKSMGFQEFVSNADTPIDVDDNNNYAATAFSVISYEKGSGESLERLQLIVPREESEVGTVINFHSTIVRCFITGWGAASLNTSLTRHKRSMVVHRSGPLNNAGNAAIEKYEARGVKYVEAYPEESFGSRTLDDAHSTIVALPREYWDKKDIWDLVVAKRTVCEKSRWYDTNRKVSSISVENDRPILRRMYPRQLDTLALELVKECHKHNLVRASGSILDGSVPRYADGYKALSDTELRCINRANIECEEAVDDRLFFQGVCVARERNVEIDPGHA